MTRALYQSVAAMNNDALVQEFAAWVDQATSSMLASAPDAAIQNVQATNLTLVTVIFGTVRNAFERNLPPDVAEELRHQLVPMCQAYLRSFAAQLNASRSSF